MLRIGRGPERKSLVVLGGQSCEPTARGFGGFCPAFTVERGRILVFWRKGIFPRFAEVFASILPVFDRTVIELKSSAVEMNKRSEVQIDKVLLLFNEFFLHHDFSFLLRKSISFVVRFVKYHMIYNENIGSGRYAQQRRDTRKSKIVLRVLIVFTVYGTIINYENSGEKEKKRGYH